MTYIFVCHLFTRHYIDILTIVGGSSYINDLHNWSAYRVCRYWTDLHWPENIERPSCCFCSHESLDDVCLSLPAIVDTCNSPTFVCVCLHFPPFYSTFIYPHDDYFCLIYTEYYFIAMGIWAFILVNLCYCYLLIDRWLHTCTFLCIS